MKVGDVAKRTGVSVRTLHHYDELGLLTPARRTRSGHRLYGAREIRRLQQIRSLQQLGFSLEDVRRLIDQRDYPLRRVLAMHVATLREQIRLQSDLCDRLESIGRWLEARREVPVEAFLQAMEALTMSQAQFTPEQRKALERRGAELGEAAIREVEQAWPVLIAQVRAEMEKGTDPVSEPVLALARRWRDLVRAFTGGDAGITERLGQHYKAATADGGTPYGMDRAMFEYIGKAIAKLRDSGEPGMTG